MTSDSVDSHLNMYNNEQKHASNIVLLKLSLAYLMHVQYKLHLSYSIMSCGEGVKYSIYTHNISPVMHI